MTKEVFPCPTSNNFPLTWRTSSPRERWWNVPPASSRSWWKTPLTPGPPPWWWSSAGGAWASSGSATTAAASPRTSWPPLSCVMPPASSAPRRTWERSALWASGGRLWRPSPPSAGSTSGPGGGRTPPAPPSIWRAASPETRRPWEPRREPPFWSGTSFTTPPPA